MTMREIHPQAVVAASAKLGEGVKIGAYAVVGEDVELGDGCVLHPHAMVQGPSKFGRNNAFYAFSAIGGDAQDYTFRGERAELIAGDGNIFREYVTVSRGTQKGWATAIFFWRILTSGTIVRWAAKRCLLTGRRSRDTSPWMILRP